MVSGIFLLNNIIDNSLVAVSNTKTLFRHSGLLTASSEPATSGLQVNQIIAINRIQVNQIVAINKILQLIADSIIFLETQICQPADKRQIQVNVFLDWIFYSRN